MKKFSYGLMLTTLIALFSFTTNCSDTGKNKQSTEQVSQLSANKAQARGVYSAADSNSHVFTARVTLNADNSVDVILVRKVPYFEFTTQQPDGATGLMAFSAALFRQTLKPRSTLLFQGWHYNEGINVPTSPSPIHCNNANIMARENGTGASFTAKEIDIRFTAVDDQGNNVGSQNVHVIF